MSCHNPDYIAKFLCLDDLPLDRLEDYLARAAVSIGIVLSGVGVDFL
jgi:hypothetical protein